MWKMKFSDKVYDLVVNHVPGIQSRYHKYRNSITGVKRLGAWGYLIKLNLKYYLLKDNELQEPLEAYPDRGKKLYSEGSESSLSKRESPVDMAQKLAQYDVVSFDVFDTLILRPFSKPTDVFFFVGEKLGYLDFERIRQEMEWKARQEAYAKRGTYEITYEEIWETVEKETGIPKEKGKKIEWEIEKKYCFANPYFLEVVRELQKYKTKIIITSDMYLRKQQIGELLKTNGYPEFEEIFVSCEHCASKGDGTLYDVVRLSIGEQLSYIHVGDNKVSDQKKAIEKGFKVIAYQNVNEFGNKYRAEDMSAIIGSMYRGITNAFLHNGLNEYSIEYEYGYIYGGLFVLGYCQFIHEYLKTSKVDKILFLARDGDILNKIYQKLYPQEADLCEYVYWSRIVATKMGAQYFKYDYFRRFIYHKVNQGYTISNIFKTMELEDMLAEFFKEQKNITASTELKDSNADIVKQYLQNHWELVLEHYEEQLKAGKIYYQRVLENCRNAIAVDIGWAGSGAVTLDYIVNYIWGLNCHIQGIVAGTNTIHNSEPNTSESFLYNGRILSYLYSQSYNRDLWKIHNPGKGHNLYWELLLSALDGSLRGFYLKNNNEYELRFKDMEQDKKIIGDIQDGIETFVLQWMKHFKEIPRIDGADAYAPMRLAFEKENNTYLKMLNAAIDNPNCG